MTCATCVYWDRVDGTDTGFCHRLPPSLVPSRRVLAGPVFPSGLPRDLTGFWPETDGGTGWCGLHERRPEAAAAGETEVPK